MADQPGHAEYPEVRPEQVDGPVEPGPGWVGVVADNLGGAERGRGVQAPAARGAGAAPPGGGRRWWTTGRVSLLVVSVEGPAC